MPALSVAAAASECEEGLEVMAGAGLDEFATVKEGVRLCCGEFIEGEREGGREFKSGGMTELARKSQWRERTAVE